MPATALAFAQSYAYGRANMPEDEVGVWHQNAPPRDYSTPAAQPSILQRHLLSALLVELDATRILGVPTSWLSIIAPPLYPEELRDWIRFAESLSSMNAGDRVAAVPKQSAVYEIAAFELSIAEDADADASQKLRAHVHLLSTVDQGALMPSVSPHRSRIVSREWTAMADRGFALRNPRMTKPMLLESCAAGPDGRDKIARVLSVAADAIGASLPEWVRRLLRRPGS